MPRKNAFSALALGGLLVASLAACGEMDKKEAAPAADNPSRTSAMASTEFGPACAKVPADGPGSFAGMAKDPVATAASHNPVLSTLVAAVTAAGLGDTLNKAENITVFAPTNDAFAKIPKADLDKVLADRAMLTKILTYHVVPQRLTPEQLASGEYATLQKGTVRTAGSGQQYTVNEAQVVCGNVQTANATVYIVDTVLMPKA